MFVEQYRIMKYTLSLLITLIVINVSSAQVANSFYEELDSFLSKHVYQGLVDYKAIHSDSDQLDDLIEKVEDADLRDANPSQKQAFWINAYNLIVINSVIDRYPLKSPLDVTGFFDKAKHKAADEKLTLNDIENKKLREQYGDARFHFVLVCGAVGCPPLISKSYRPETLDQQLEQQTTAALNDPEFIRDGKKVAVSQIFEWYKADFEKDGAKTIDFINAHRKPALSGKKVKYYPYNWTLNSK